MNRTDTYSGLPRALYRAEAVRELDRLAIEEHAIAGFELMQRASAAALALLQARLPGVSKIAVVCGAGNNGGDGYVLAALAARQGIAVEVIGLAPVQRLQGDALLARQMAEREGLVIKPQLERFADDVDVLVDALLGTGLQGDVRPAYAEAIVAMNRSGLPLLALDIPSGLCSDTGRVLGSAVRARWTMTFIGVKRGMFTGQGRDYCGEVCFSDLDVPEAVFEAIPGDCERLELATLTRRLGARSRAGHKGNNGHVLVVGGELGMGGAGILAARAAGRAGAGLVSLATRAPHVPAALAQAPELMASAVASGQDLQPLLKAATVVVVGPGLGRGSWAEQLLLQCWRSDKPLVLDADALNLLAERPQAGVASRQEWVITPHPGEAARLLGWSVAQVQADRFAAVRELHSRFHTQVILKGSGSLIVDNAGSLALCPYGNPGMASGGMGDVLSGVIGALLAQGLDPAFAVRLATAVHAYAADLAANHGERGLLAGDLLPLIRKLLNPVPWGEATAGGE